MKLSMVSCCFLLLLSASGARAEQAPARSAAGGALGCDFRLALLPPWKDLVPEIERDRAYKSAQPGFRHEWVGLGMRPSGPWAVILVTTDGVGDAAAFSSWLDQLDLGGTRFWDRPEFRNGHQCRVYEVLGSEDHSLSQEDHVNMREERFQVPAGTTRDQLRGWYAQVRDESHRRGDTAVMLLYSEPDQLASLVRFSPVPLPGRDVSSPPPIGAQAPFLPPHTGTLDWSAWVLTVFFPFEPGDHGRPSLWPLPGIEPKRGDGVCEVSRHESWHTAPEDCPKRCGDGVPDPDEDWTNCPGDVPLP